ncbi:hypothetical protein [Comamonas endophytica]|uniref:Secreted protein n=1 Tax=Comamonas endophytica TaxID=2949090 RepID=A0ABY6G6B1_9BURK|nr:MULTISPECIES: hypothetical protein [unclassified Acidovorax]MCD2511153.1 hypothetical protein [Acidovorax sp. D4N7]UYG50555.1 hypothetical protein M9799_10630 [Acidovorax sp. 5MLIR]
MIALGLAPAGSAAENGGDGRFHHLIALFSTVAANRCAATAGVTIICNEIKDLERSQKPCLGKKPLPHKHLLNSVHVNSQAPHDCGCTQAGAQDVYKRYWNGGFRGVNVTK